MNNLLDKVLSEINADSKSNIQKRLYCDCGRGSTPQPINPGPARSLSENGSSFIYLTS